MTNVVFQMESAVDLELLIQSWVRRGYDAIAPVSRDQTIMLAKVGSVSDLPRGMTDIQEKGRYRLLRDPRDQSFFGYNLGPSSLKSYLFPERRRLWQLKRKSDPEASGNGSPAFALLAVRACELAAITVQDRVFIKTGADPEYRR